MRAILSLWAYLENVAASKRSIGWRFGRLFELTPAVVAHDLHPDYLATRRALELAERAGLPTVAVQHHHAHIASCLADNECDGPVIGLAFDGTGLGPDGTIWGGEVLVADRADYRRAGALRPFRLAGGEAAVREGWRVACDLAEAAGVAYQAGTTPDRQAFVNDMLARDLRCLATTSAGRLFDGFSALLGVREVSRYRGGAVLGRRGHRCHGACRSYCSRRDRWCLMAAGSSRRGGGGGERGNLRCVPSRGGDAAVRLAVRVADETGVRTVALSGGCFQNRLLAELVAAGLEAEGLAMLRHRRVPPNDGGLSLGQAAVAAARLGGT